MKRAKFVAAAAVFISVGVVMVSFAQEKKAAAIKEASGGEVGEIRLRTMAPITYVYVETETTFGNIGDAINVNDVRRMRSEAPKTQPAATGQSLE